jgi:DNA-binding CsgD family transcriptional regulator
VLRAKGAVGKLDQWDSLIGELYESVLNPGSLLPALGKIDQWMGSSFCHLLAWDDRNNRARLNVLTNDVLDGGILKKYADYYGSIDPRRELSLTLAAGHVFACHDHFDERFVGKSEFYQDLLIPGGARYILGAYVIKEDGLSAYLVFNHLEGQGYFSEQQRQAAIRLIPHVQRTIRLALQNERFRGGLIAGATGLDALEQAVFTLDASERVIFLNSAARSLVGAGSWIKIRAGQLVATVSKEAEKFRAAIMRARLSRQPESFALYGAGNSVGEPSDTQVVTILPIPHDGVHSAVGGGINLLDRGKEATLLSLEETELVVLIAPQRRKSAMSAAALKALFKLTPAEARLSHELAKGVSVEEYAEAAAISVATARTQLRSVLGKTGEKRLQDLVRMLSGLPGKH